MHSVLLCFERRGHVRFNGCSINHRVFIIIFFLFIHLYQTRLRYICPQPLGAVLPTPRSRCGIVCSCVFENACNIIFPTHRVGVLRSYFSSLSSCKRVFRILRKHYATAAQKRHIVVLTQARPTTVRRLHLFTFYENRFAPCWFNKLIVVG